MIDGLGVRLDSGLLRYWDWWVTPVSEPRRYDTRFFVARLPADAVVTPHTGEVVEETWAMATDVDDTSSPRRTTRCATRWRAVGGRIALGRDTAQIAAVRPVLEGDEIGLPWGDRFPLPKGFGNA